ncbi:stimulus-sensing domain-containing protein [Emcibacter nanhaiensis]|uniref:histidine kinase n=1 Tax=Emcibacter nanhaiensis TaxID=1505037 RepID=A0A501PP00_9PROT|nr:stimulus-sensing domain-containing protein [Emcibacter nanhaiensis]TPD61832.1 HAMP domain-containing protein [Emcibacter nanhaiensis]
MSPDTKPSPIRTRPKRGISPLTIRILLVNLIALIFLGGGILYVDDLQQTLIESRIDSLRKDAEILAGALGEAATGGPDTTEIELIPAQQIITRLVDVTQNRTRFFDVSGAKLIDSRDLAVEQSIVVNPLPPEGGLDSFWDNLSWKISSILDRLNKRYALGEYREKAHEVAEHYPEVLEALAGENSYRIRVLTERFDIITVAVPVQRFRRVLGALMVSADDRDIREAVQDARMTILKLFFAALLLTLTLSTFFARTIVRPILRLAYAADRIRMATNPDYQIPDYSRRNDEIGDLSRSLREMTDTLARQIDAVASFAADVAHELKNPLTSVRSAIETLSFAKKEEDKQKLLAIIQQDVQRLDRLISDISDASRLDAELARSSMELINMTAMVETLLDIYDTTQKDKLPDLVLEVDGSRRLRKSKENKPHYVMGLEGQLGQVVRNLLDNAISFSRSEGHVWVRLREHKNMVELVVEDEGVGIPEDKLDSIFERFYSERPKGEAFGKHSGLGLSICKQIVESHGGTITAENREEGGGARFIVRLPRAEGGRKQ